MQEEVARQNGLELRCIHTVRFLSLDMVERAKSGHPGTPMGAADMAFTLWDRFLKHNPRDTNWINRDRFVLSPGHASAMLYSLLYLTGYDVSIEDLRNFRQWGSRTPGHPEYGLTPGVSATTGPLGQGFANGIGMAMAERWLSDHYNRSGYQLIDHYTYGIVSDGDLQEGVTSEAASLAGTLKLGKLVYLYDSNDIQIEGSTKLAFSENVARRFDAYGWQVIGPIRGTDIEAIDAAIRKGRAEKEKPTLIICKTIIGHYSPIEGTARIHGEPLTELETTEAKKSCNWPVDPPFYVPQDVLPYMRRAIERGKAAQQEWNQLFEDYARSYPDLAERLRLRLSGQLPSGWDRDLDNLFPAGTPALATRDASGKTLNALVERVHGLTGGSGDLAPSTKTFLVGYGNFGWKEHSGHNMHFGVREHAMGAIANGMALHGGVIPYTATFLVFSDYMRPPMRLAAMMGIQVFYIFSHDSIGVGQDGPTHQPIEQLMNLRAVPNLIVIRPADAHEASEAWRAALLNKNGPTAMVLSRQKLPVLDQTQYASARNLQHGAYTLWQTAEGTPDVIIIGTGSEVHVALEAGRKLASEKIRVRVVSMPSWELFDKQPSAYRESVLPSSVHARLAVEAGIRLGWEHYVGLEGAVIGMDSFGASAPGDILFEKFGITPDHVAQTAKDLIRKTSRRE
jgi:transketolase